MTGQPCPTDLSNLIPLCNMHHHLIRESHWTITLDEVRTLTIVRPDGVTHTVVPLEPLGNRRAWAASAAGAAPDAPDQSADPARAGPQQFTVVG